MRWCLDRWRGRAALLAILCLFAAPVAAGLDDGPNKKDPTKTEEKNPLIEDAMKRLMEGKPDDALKLLEEAVKKKPELPPARLMLARLMLQIREYQPRVRLVIEQTIKESPDHPAPYLDIAQLAMAEGRVTEAVLDCERALALAAGDRWTKDQKKDAELKARDIMARAYEAREDWAHARSELSTLMTKDANSPLNPQYRARLARALFFQDKTEDAYKEMQAAVKMQPAVKPDDKNPPARLDPPDVAMAIWWAQKGDATKAREFFERAAKAEPKNPRVHVAYADWLTQRNEIPQAKLQIDDALKLKADDVEVQKFQGLIARAQKEYAKAESIFKAVLVSSPDDVFARNHLALVLIDQPGDEKHKQALEHAQLNVKANQKAGEAWATLAYIAYKLNNVNEAAQAIQQSLNASNGGMSPDTAYYLALIMKDRDPDKAKAILKEATSIAAKGLFIYKDEAKDLYEKLDKAPPPKTGGPSSK